MCWFTADVTCLAEATPLARWTVVSRVSVPPDAVHDPRDAAKVESSPVMRSDSPPPPVATLVQTAGTPTPAPTGR
jgi:hypothetical protein